MPLEIDYGNDSDQDAEGGYFGRIQVPLASGAGVVHYEQKVPRDVLDALALRPSTSIQAAFPAAGEIGRAVRSIGRRRRRGEVGAAGGTGTGQMSGGPSAGGYSGDPSKGGGGQDFGQQATNVVTAILPALGTILGGVFGGPLGAAAGGAAGQAGAMGIQAATGNGNVDAAATFDNFANSLAQALGLSKGSVISALASLPTRKAIGAIAQGSSPGLRFVRPVSTTALKATGLRQIGPGLTGGRIGVRSDPTAPIDASGGIVAVGPTTGPTGTQATTGLGSSGPDSAVPPGGTFISTNDGPYVPGQHGLRYNRMQMPNGDVWMVYQNPTTGYYYGHLWMTAGQVPNVTVTDPQGQVYPVGHSPQDAGYGPGFDPTSVKGVYAYGGGVTVSAPPGSGGATAQPGGQNSGSARLNADGTPYNPSQQAVPLGTDQSGNSYYQDTNTGAVTGTDPQGNFLSVDPSQWAAVFANAQVQGYDGFDPQAAAAGLQNLDPRVQSQFDPIQASLPPGYQYDTLGQVYDQSGQIVGTLDPSVFGASANQYGAAYGAAAVDPIVFGASANQYGAAYGAAPAGYAVDPMTGQAVDRYGNPYDPVNAAATAAIDAESQSTGQELSGVPGAVLDVADWFHLVGAAGLLTGVLAMSAAGTPVPAAVVDTLTRALRRIETIAWGLVHDPSDTMTSWTLDQLESSHPREKTAADIVSVIAGLEIGRKGKRQRHNKRSRRAVQGIEIGASSYGRW